ncbi:hypothetical protein MRX96_054977 [Rhipicephalus microplus]
MHRAVTFTLLVALAASKHPEVVRTTATSMWVELCEESTTCIGARMELEWSLPVPYRMVLPASAARPTKAGLKVKLDIGVEIPNGKGR